MKPWQKVVIGLVIVGVLWWAYTNGYFSSPMPTTNPNQNNGGGVGFGGAAGGPAGSVPGTTSGSAYPPGVSAGSTIVPGGSNTAVPVIDPSTGQPFVDAGGNTIYTNIAQTFNPIGANNYGAPIPNTGNAAMDSAIAKQGFVDAVEAAIQKGAAATNQAPVTQHTNTPSTVATNGNGTVNWGALHGAITTGQVH